ncbi:MAG: 30S ribosomal protein S5 [Candidatus Gracilibacteria bacterium]
MQRGGPGRGKFIQKREAKEFEEEVIEIDRVTKVVKGGRKMRFRATVVIGNRKGKVGMGIGKSNEVTGAIQKAIAKAKKNLLTVKLDGTTIPHDVKIKYKSSRILLIPAAPGTGLIAGSSIRKVLELVGVKDILSKSLGTSNKVNNTKGAFEALKALRETPFMVRKAAALIKAKEAPKPIQKPVPKEEPAEQAKQ